MRLAAAPHQPVRHHPCRPGSTRRIPDAAPWSSALRSHPTCRAARRMPADQPRLPRLPCVAPVHCHPRPGVHPVRRRGVKQAGGQHQPLNHLSHLNHLNHRTPADGPGHPRPGSPAGHQARNRSSHAPATVGRSNFRPAHGRLDRLGARTAHHACSHRPPRYRPEAHVVLPACRVRGAQACRLGTRRRRRRHPGALALRSGKGSSLECTDREALARPPSWPDSR